MPNAPLQPVATLGIDIGKNSFHLIGLDACGAILLRQKLSHGQVEARLANMPACPIGMEACVGAHHLSRQLLALGHDVELIPVQFVLPFRKSHQRYHDGHGGVGADLGGGHGSNSGLGSSGSSRGN
ncbi:MAG: transposase [Microvirga sp.]|nr:transposase [Microvirga sp.]